MDITFRELCSIINKQQIKNDTKAQLLHTILNCLFHVAVDYDISDDSDLTNGKTNNMYVYKHYGMTLLTNISPESISNLKPYLFQYIEEDRWNKYYDFEPYYNTNFKSPFHFGIFVFYAQMMNNKLLTHKLSKTALDNIIVNFITGIEELAHTEETYHLNNLNYIDYRLKFSDEICQIRTGINDHLLRYDLQAELLYHEHDGAFHEIDSVKIHLGDVLYTFTFGNIAQLVNKMNSEVHYHTTIDEKNQFITVKILNTQV